MRSRACLLLGVLAHVAWCATAAAESSNFGMVEALTDCVPASKPADCVFGKLDEHEVWDDVLNRAASAFLEAEGVSGLLDGFSIEFKYFDASEDDSEDESTTKGLGFAYHYDRSLLRTGLLADEGGPNGLDLSFNVRTDGNVAFDQDINPTDFLEFEARVSIFQRLGGGAVSSPEQSDALQAALVQAGQLGDLPPDELDAHPAWKTVEESLEPFLEPELFWDFAGRVAYETNQDFSSEQLAYGARLGLVPRSRSRKSVLSQFNLLDWPFAAMRYLTGADSSFTPTGRALPLVIAGIDLVDPKANEERLAVDPDDGMYSRARLEVAARTRLARISGQAVSVAGSFRYYQEIDASLLVSQAGLDDHQYIAVHLELPAGVVLTYANGKMPLDQKDDEVFELGFRYSL